MRYTGPRNRLARREGQDLGLKTVGSKSHANLLRRMNIRPGQRPNARYKKSTEYGRQLREKQKLKRIYSLSEVQLKKYFTEASHLLGNTAHFLIQQLETRLDNAVYRLGLAPTRAGARQLVNHGHILVNGKKCSIPSYKLKAGDVISFKKEKTMKIPYIEESLKRTDISLPIWLGREKNTGKVMSLPDVDAMTDDVDLQSVIEFYSR